jgi:hypothetical protein
MISAEETKRFIAAYGDYMRILQPTEDQKKTAQEIIEYLKGERND